MAKIAKTKKVAKGKARSPKKASVVDLKRHLNSKKHSRYYQYWPLIIPAGFLIGFLTQISLPWLIGSTFSQANTYPKATILGQEFGNLDLGQLGLKLDQLKSSIETGKITLANQNDEWLFAASDLGVNFDVEKTKKVIRKLNDLDIKDKWQVIVNEPSQVITPIITIDKNKCEKSLSVIRISETKPSNASFYYERGIIIKPDQEGMKFNPIKTCEELPNRLSNNEFSSGVYYDKDIADITKAGLDSKLSQVRSMANEKLSFQGGGYSQILTQKQLLSMIDIKKTGSKIKISWNNSKLDAFVNSVAKKVNTYDSAPALNSCQYLISNGGNWLDKDATKNIFNSLTSNKTRSYNLPISHHSPSIKTMSKIPNGKNGTVFLTFDDGMQYGNQIMNYASCYGVKVTFFEIGERAGVDAVALRRAIAEGHTVQSHGHYHAIYDYGSRSYNWQKNDLAQSINDIKNVTGIRPTYFRPPGGNRSDNTYKAAAANGLKLILWGATSADSGGLTSSQTCSNVVSRAFAGASVLMHSTHASTAAAFPCIVEGLAARGFNMQAMY